MEHETWTEEALRNDIRRLRNDLARLRDIGPASVACRPLPEAVSSFEPGEAPDLAGLADPQSVPEADPTSQPEPEPQPEPEGRAGRIMQTLSPSVAVVISTFAALPYVHLALESRRRHYPHVPVLVHDDASPLAPDLEQLCSEYGVDFSCNPYRMHHSTGDISAFVSGLDWAARRGADLLVKMSRRFIPLNDWVPALQALAWETQYATYSQVCRAWGFGFRTECIGLHVPTWRHSPAFDDLCEHTLPNKPVLVEAHLHMLARRLHQSACDVNREYESRHPRQSDSNAYGVWTLMPDSRMTRSTDVLWHNCDAPMDYARIAQLFGLPYRADDFEDPNHGCGFP